LDSDTLGPLLSSKAISEALIEARLHSRTDRMTGLRLQRETYRKALRYETVSRSSHKFKHSSRYVHAHHASQEEIRPPPLQEDVEGCDGLEPRRRRTCSHWLGQRSCENEPVWE
ncbi:hypothetical protein KCU76_g39, partial [Aureobasidium melanogenum]